jgi:hypothetical protein
MNAHIQLTASEQSCDDAERHESDDSVADRDEASMSSASTSSASTGSASTSSAPAGLPEEEADSNEILGGAPPPLVAEPRDRAGARPRSRSGLARLIALAWPPKAKAEGPDAKAGDEGDVESQDAGGRRDEPHDVIPQGAEAEAERSSPAPAARRQEKRPIWRCRPYALLALAHGAGKVKRSSAKRKGALAVVLLASVAVAAIAVLDWPRRTPPTRVEPGMLADGETKLMAPSAALATVPPREAPNVPRERPLVEETRPSEIAEMLSFKGLKREAAGGTGTAAKPGTPAAPLGAAQAAKPEVALGKESLTKAPAPAEPHESVALAATRPISEGAVIPPAVPAAKPAEPAEPAKPLDARVSAIGAAQPQAVAALLPTREASGGKTASPAAPEAKPTPPLRWTPSAPSPAVAAGGGQPVAQLPAAPQAASAPHEPGLGESAKIESRLADLETALKDRTSERRARVEAEKAETHTLEKIAELAAFVTRLTGQVKDLQDRVQTLSNGSEEKFADLTRRVALGEANRAVTSAENAAGAGAGGTKPENAASNGSDGEERTHMKVVAAPEVKRSYRIQAASPGLAMLTAVDGSPDDRPVEVAIGTNLPGYGRVLSIEQHGEAWVVKADRGSIE